jgi:membrane associated rhomboid family serine protease
VALIGLSVGAFTYELFLDPAQQTVFFYRWGLIPAELSTGREFNALLVGPYQFDIASTLPAWGTVFSSMFLHGGILHIAGNMLYLWVFGDNVEDRLGHVKFVFFYLAAGAAAALTQVAINRGSEAPMIGASGAIGGVLGAYIWLYPRSRINTLTTFLFITVVQVPAVLLLGFWFGLQFFSGVGSLGAGSAFSGGVAYWAHIGGFLAGLLATALYTKVTREPTGWRH